MSNNQSFRTLTGNQVAKIIDESRESDQSLLNDFSRKRLLEGAEARKSYVAPLSPSRAAKILSNVEEMKRKLAHNDEY